MIRLYKLNDGALWKQFGISIVKGQYDDEEYFIYDDAKGTQRYWNNIGHITIAGFMVKLSSAKGTTHFLLEDADVELDNFLYNYIFG